MDVHAATADRTSGCPDALVVLVGTSGISVDDLGLAPESVEALRTYLESGPSELSRAGNLGRVARPSAEPPDPPLLLVAGVGGATATELRIAGATIARHAGVAAVTVGGLAALVRADAPPSIDLPPSIDTVTAALVEGLLLGDYRFSRASTPAASELRTVHLGSAAGIDRARVTAAATLWARDLANTRSSVKTPQWLAEQARAELVPLGVTVIERDVDWLTEHRFGGILGVGAGSVAPPRLIEAAWNPRRSTRADKAQHVVLVGKSITFDSGGLNIKPLDSMTSMYTDMAGGAAVLGALRMIATLRIPIRVTALLPAAENSVSGSAMRTGDVIRHYGGRTSEVGNTDAEGRLVLADALAYAAARLKPTVMVDLATLTGAMKVALGVRTGGVFATDDNLAADLIAAGAAAGEPLWRLPLADEYLYALSSDIADANNSPGNPGAINAALYLRAFCGAVPWAHLDIAGSARSTDDQDELSRGATGFGARLLGEWLLRRADRTASRP